jgi:hypothetical protein
MTARLAELKNMGVELNLNWVRTHPEHVLTKEFEYSSSFVDHEEGYETSPEITAEAICDKLGLRRRIPFEFSIETALLHAIRNNIVLRVEMGTFDHKGQEGLPDHVVITDGKLMFDSFYEYRAITCREVNLNWFLNCGFPSICAADVTQQESANWVFRSFVLEP